MAFHPASSTVLATLGNKDTVIRIWNLDPEELLDGVPAIQSVHYTNAKVVLVADSGVGKSGLGLVLSGQPFALTESTHGRNIWRFESRQKENRETLLWDLAGRSGYRVFHQLHLQQRRRGAGRLRRP